MPARVAKKASTAEVFHRQTFEGNDLQFANFEVRLDSFAKSSIGWPFDENCSCTPEKMAEAGFYLVGTEKEPDLARCYWQVQ